MESFSRKRKSGLSISLLEILLLFRLEILLLFPPEILVLFPLEILLLFPLEILLLFPLESVFYPNCGSSVCKLFDRMIEIVGSYDSIAV